MHVLRFGHKLNEEVCRGFIFANLFNSLNLATDFQDLIALAPGLGAISRPLLLCFEIWSHERHIGHI